MNILLIEFRDGRKAHRLVADYTSDTNTGLLKALGFDRAFRDSVRSAKVQSVESVSNLCSRIVGTEVDARNSVLNYLGSRKGGFGVAQQYARSCERETATEKKLELCFAEIAGEMI